MHIDLLRRSIAERMPDPKMDLGRSRKAMVLLSGGIDSMLALSLALNNCSTVEALSIDYGQRARVETAQALEIAELLKVRTEIVSIGLLGRKLDGNPITDYRVEVPHYSAGTQPISVPGRMFMIISSALSVAVSRGFTELWIGTTREVAREFPDSNESVLSQLNRSIDCAYDVRLVMPLLYLTKHEAMQAVATATPDIVYALALTYSCLVGGELHCGRCWGCNERRKAFPQAGFMDPAQYEPER